MMTGIRFLMFVLACAHASAWAASISAYYAPAAGLSGAPLRSALHQIVRGHTVIPYSSSTRFDTSDALQLLDEDPAATNNVLLLYAQRSEPKSTFALVSGWNREHLWCDSYGLDGQEPAYSDLHNLRAEDATVNSARGNKLYDFSNPGDPNFRPAAHAEAPLASADSDSWQPPASVRGDIARALLYMAVRYTGDVPNEPRLALTDDLNLIQSTNTAMGRYTTVLRWHFDDPVSAGEVLRNERIYALQGNRNPFVDNPAWVGAAFLPVLRLSHAPPNLVLQWTNDFTPAVVPEQSTNLAVWVPVPNSPQLTTSNSWAVTVTPPSGAPATFYRLRLQ